MNRVAILLCLISRVITGMAYERHIFSQQIMRRARSEIPSNRDYSYSHYSDLSGMYAPYTYGSTEYNPFYSTTPVESKTADKLGLDMHRFANILPETVTESFKPYVYTPSVYESDYELSRLKADARYKQLSQRYSTPTIISESQEQKITHYSPPKYIMNDIMSDYDTISDYHNDDDDVRSSTGTMYDSYWPYIYHSPYDYEHKKETFDKETVKDKRYSPELPKDTVIPVHEHIENDLPIGYPVTPKPTDNPIGGHEPFFSFVLNDYFDSNREEDPLTFKGLAGDWGKGYDSENYLPELDDGSKRNRRIQSSYYSKPDISLEAKKISSGHSSGVTVAPSVIHSSTSHYKHTYGYPKPRDFKLEDTADVSGQMKQNEFENSESFKSKHKTGYEHDLKKMNGFKDFVDTFANKFGSENHKRDSKFAQLANNDKGEKKKGFRRVYHKDEFQEDNEYFDNSNSTTKAEERGSSNAEIGGSEAILRSQAAAVSKNEQGSTNNAGNTGTENSSHSSNLGKDKLYSYADVAKQAANSNNADYSDYYKV